MKISDRFAAGFDRSAMLCVGLHVHTTPSGADVAVDFFGFYFNLSIGRSAW